MFPMNRRPVAVVVEYDGKNGERSIKEFPDMYKGRRFYTAKDKEGKNPNVRVLK